jgi:hypothetical protein
MQSKETDPFALKDFFRLDPFNEIYLRKREDTDFFNTYMDYRQYLEYLAIIWQRIKNESKEIGVYHAEQLKLVDTYEQHPEKWRSLVSNEQRMLTMLQCDVETFIMFSRIFMNKVAEVIEQLIKIPRGKQPREGFTKHKDSSYTLKACC